MVNKGKFVGHFFEVYMLFWKLVNMLLRMRKLAKDPSASLLNLHKYICINVSLGLKNWEGRQEWIKTCINSRIPLKKTKYSSENKG